MDTHFGAKFHPIVRVTLRKACVTHLKQSFRGILISDLIKIAQSQSFFPHTTSAITGESRERALWPQPAPVPGKRDVSRLVACFLSIQAEDNQERRHHN
jgi:hypothetical protein